MLKGLRKKEHLAPDSHEKAKEEVMQEESHIADKATSIAEPEVKANVEKDASEEVEEEENVLKLEKPIKINGKTVDRLPYDFEGMTARDKLRVGKHMKKDGIPISVEDIDGDYHTYLFAAAVCKADPSIDLKDVLRISAKDSRMGSKLARDFFYLDLEEYQTMD